MSLSTVCLDIKRQTQISQSLYLHKEEEEDEEEAQKPAESVLQSSLNAPPHRDWMPHFAATVGCNQWQPLQKFSRQENVKKCYLYSYVQRFF